MTPATWYNPGAYLTVPAPSITVDVGYEVPTGPRGLLASIVARTSVCHTGLEPRTSRQGPRQVLVCDSRVWALPCIVTGDLSTDLSPATACPSPQVHAPRPIAVALSKARLTRVSGRPLWGLLVQGSSPNRTPPRVRARVRVRAGLAGLAGLAAAPQIGRAGGAGLSKARLRRVSSRPVWDPVCSSGVRALCCFRVRVRALCCFRVRFEPCVALGLGLGLG